MEELAGSQFNMEMWRRRCACRGRCGEGEYGFVHRDGGTGLHGAWMFVNAIRGTTTEPVLNFIIATGFKFAPQLSCPW